MLEKCKISGFADEIDSSFDVQLRVLKELGQKFLELRGADGVGVADLSMEKAAELKEKLKKNCLRFNYSRKSNEEIITIPIIGRITEVGGL